MKNAEALQVTTPTEREIMLTRSFAAPRQLVFDALTKPEMVQRWMLGPPGWSMSVCKLDLRVGGALRFGWRHSDGREMGLSGVYRDIRRPERIAHTELFDEDWTGGETLVTNVLVERGGKTTLTCTILYASREARDAVRATAMSQGVAAGYDSLAALLASAAAPGG